ncbi:MAG: AarF/ABC1/UbiB kinase family protein [Bdellovibrionota bacterium]
MAEDPKEENKEKKKKVRLKQIPTTRFARGMKIAKLTATVSAQALGGKMASLFSSKAEKEIERITTQVRQAQKIVEALSQMKGAAMKLGQILSIHGEHLFPREVVDVLARLQQNSDEMDFSEIEKVLKAELGEKYERDLTQVSETPIASASIGQVHKGLHASSQTPVAVKVQYPGVERSIDSDVNSLASIAGVLTKVPAVESFNAVTEEIKTLLHQETDYLAEAKHLELFRKRFESDEAIVIPKAFSDVSTSRVLTTELVGGISVQAFADSTASPTARASLGKKYLEVFYTELFDLGLVQTDPNFANYKVEWAFGIDDPRLVLLDFGAVKTFDRGFRTRYRRLSRVCLDDDFEGIRREAVDIGFLKEEDSKEQVELHYQMVKLFMEPFRKDLQPYRWHESNLIERAKRIVPRFIFSFKLRPPPRDVIFLNRKIVGAYFFCSAIKAVFDPRQLLESFIDSEKK